MVPKRRRAAGLTAGAAILMLLATAGGAQAKGHPPPYAMPRTQVLTLRAAANGQEYVLYVALPRSLGPGRRYPVVYLLDADYSFAVARNVVEHFSDRDDLPELVVVGVSYPGGIDVMDDYRRRRTRDYTPTRSLEGGYGPEFQKLSGGGPAFRDALERDLMPFVESRYPIDPSDRTLVGHSYGGLFATWVLLTKPALFRRYVAVSPSLWYDGRMVFDLEKRTARERRGVPADVFLSVGGFESGRMVGDLLALATALRLRADPAVRVETHVFEEETHDSVFPGAFTKGILAVRGLLRRPGVAEPSGLPGQVRLPEMPVVGGAPVERTQQP